MVEATDWVQQTSSLPVVAGVRPASFLWPLTPNAEDIDEDQGELVIKPTKMCLDVGCLTTCKIYSRVDETQV